MSNECIYHSHEEISGLLFYFIFTYKIFKTYFGMFYTQSAFFVLNYFK